MLVTINNSNQIEVEADNIVGIEIIRGKTGTSIFITFAGTEYSYKQFRLEDTDTSLDFHIDESNTCWKAYKNGKAGTEI